MSPDDVIQNVNNIIDKLSVILKGGGHFRPIVIIHSPYGIVTMNVLLGTFDPNIYRAAKLAIMVNATKMFVVLETILARMIDEKFVSQPSILIGIVDYREKEYGMLSIPFKIENQEIAFGNAETIEHDQLLEVFIHPDSPN